MIHEDPDNIGYWAGFDPYENLRRPDDPSPSIALCEMLLPEWPSITESALLSHQGLRDEAEKSRRRGGYGDLGTDPGVWSYDS